MGKASRRKKLKHSKKIRERSDLEIAELVVAYKNLYPSDSFLANLMIVCSELSEYMPIPIKDPKKLAAFVEKNKDGLIRQFVKRFKSVDVCAIPGLFDSPDDTGSRSGALNEDKMPPVAAGPAGGMGRA